MTNPASPQVTTHASTTHVSTTHATATSAAARYAEAKRRESNKHVRGLVETDHKWCRAVAVRLRAAGVPDADVNTVIVEAVSMFTRRGRHADDVHGAPRVFVAKALASLESAGSVRHRGHALRTFLGLPLVVAAVVLTVLGVVAGPLVLAAVGAVALLLAVVVGLSAARVDATLPPTVVRNHEVTNTALSPLGW